MSTLEDIINPLRDIVVNALDTDDDPIGDEEELLISGMLDSMAVISITSELENCFRIEIPPMDITIENFESISAMANYIAGKIND